MFKGKIIYIYFQNINKKAFKHKNLNYKKVGDTYYNVFEGLFIENNLKFYV